jgi:Flp pilus assembly protein TadD
VNGAFQYDDLHAIVDNPSIRHWDPLGYFASSKAFSSGGEGGNYRPVTVTSLALNARWGGMRPGGFLLVNLILHAANSWLVYLIGRRLLASDRWAAVAAVAYAVHPVNSEAVNYAVARSSVLSSFLAFSSFWALLRRDEGMRGALGLSVTAFGLALLSKEAALALLPPVIVKGWLTRRSDRRGVEAVAADSGSAANQWDRPVILSFIGVSAGFVILWRFMSSGGLLATPEGPAAYPAWAFLEIVVKGLALWVWPSPLGLDHPIVFAGRFDGVLAVLCVLVIGSLAVLAFWARPRAPVVAWLLVWIGAAFGPLLPLPWLTTRGLFQENRLTFAAAGLAWLTAWACRVAAPWAAGLVRRHAIRRLILVGLSGGLVFAAVVIDRGRSAVWRDDLRLWQEVVSRRGDDYLAHATLGIVYRRHRKLDDSAGALERATALEPNSLWVAMALAQTYRLQGRTEETERVLVDALTRWNPAARVRRDAAAMSPSGAVMWGDPKQAQAIRLALGELYLSVTDLERAHTVYEEATRADASDYQAWYNLGVVAERRGDVETARAAYDRARILAPHERRIAAAAERLTAGSP